MTRDVPPGGPSSSAVAGGGPGMSSGRPYTSAPSATIASMSLVAGGSPAGTVRISKATRISCPTAMARDWGELFITGDGAAARLHETEEAEPERRRGFFRRLRVNMSKTRQALQAEVQATLFEGDLDEATWERLEEALIMADVGAPTTAKVVGQLEQEAHEGGLTGGEQLTQRLTQLLADIARTGADQIDLRHEPTVILAVGVNGTGKTTTIGKLAWHL